MIDVYLTSLMLSIGGMELNPIIVSAMEGFGIIEGMLIVKLPILLILGTLVWLHNTGRWISSNTRIGWWLQADFHKTLNFCNIFYIAVNVYTLILLYT
jgi:hypothetical protein